MSNQRGLIVSIIIIIFNYVFCMVSLPHMHNTIDQADLFKRGLCNVLGLFQSFATAVMKLIKKLKLI